MIVKGSSNSFELRAVYAFVSYEKQEELWNVGRDLEGNPLCDKSGNPLTLTSAKAGQSWHNFGMAIDLAYFQQDTLIEPNKNRNLYYNLGVIAKSLGIVWGGTFTPWFDATHFEWHGPFNEVAEAAYITNLGGIDFLWKVITERLNGLVQ